MANINPTQEDIAGRIPELREKFQKKFASQLSGGEYDDRDVQRLLKDDRYAGAFLRSLLSKGDPDKALNNVNECLKFRKDNGLNDLTLDSFPAEIKDKNAIYYKGKDKDGHPIMYINVKENSAKADQQQILKQYIAFQFEQYHKDHCGDMAVVLFDMSGATTSNMSIDISKYIIACFSNYFPSFLAYMINYEMPFLLSATWTIISAFVRGDSKKKVLILKKKDIGKYIPEEHLWPHMKD